MASNELPALVRQSVDALTAAVNRRMTLAAGNYYDTTAEGLAATAVGDYFSIVSAASDSYVDLYRHETDAAGASIATWVDTYPNKAAVDNAVAAAEAEAAKAATSATNAATSETNAAASASAAQTAETGAKTAYDNFDDRYLGSFATTAQPTVDNDGGVLLVGAIYWNTTVSELRFWNGTAWEAPTAEAAASASAAATSETNAKTSETNAKTSETNAKTSETNAKSSETLAADWAEKGDGLDVNGVGTRSAKHHAGQAATSASNAKTSETNAANSATTATNAKDAAVAAEANTVSLYDSFDDRFLGTKTADPTADNDGAALLVGSMYYNSTALDLRFWNGTAWEIASADAARTAAANAEASANAAATSETNAAASANAAKTSETNAATSATDANNSLVSFKGTYLGDLASDPTVDGNGAALGSGELYFNTTTLKLRVYNGTAWGDVDGADTSGALLAANNLSDLADAAAARTNLGGVPLMDDVVAMAIALG